jgi:hypothetical protein
MSVTIENTHGKVTIPCRYIEVLKSVMGPVNLFLQGKALGIIGQQIVDGLSKYQKGDIVQINDECEFGHSGLYKIIDWNLSSKGNVHMFDLGLKHE